MNEVWCLNRINGEEFTLRFNDLQKQRKFLLKCKHSKKIMILGYTWQTENQRLYLERGY